MNNKKGVQIHMTNTRTTDIEIIEKRYPVIVREFSIRSGSGGRGQFRGGDGVVRDWECRRPLTFGLITERRVHQPYGMFGGAPGACGANYWVQRVQRDDGTHVERWINIGSRGQVDMRAGDRCVIHTPGGGGWGPADDNVEDEIDRIVREEWQRGTDSNGVSGEIRKAGVLAYPRAAGSFHAFAASQEAST